MKMALFNKYKFSLNLRVIVVKMELTQMLSKVITYFLILWTVGDCADVDIGEICTNYNNKKTLLCQIPSYLNNEKDLDFYSSYTRDVDFLKFENTSISRIPNNLFYYFNYLTTLKLDYINLQSLQSTNFQQASYLLDLSLIGNKLHQLTSEVFVNAGHLVTLHLQKNKLKLLQQGCFNGIKNLRTLDLSGNLLSSLDENTFSEVKNLQEINLSNNILNGLHRNIFLNNKDLRVIDLSSNDIRYIHGNTFVNLKLEKLDVSNNNFRKLSLHYVNTLIASKSGLVEISVENHGEMDELIANHNEIEKINLKTMSIKNLDLSNNRLLSLTGLMNTSLGKLDVSFNPTLKKYDFLSNFIITEHLKINSNNITDLSKVLTGSDVNNLQLERLDISNNLLSSFDFESLKRISNLQSIDISNNNLASVNYNGLKENYSFDLDRVELSGNPWNCTELKNIIKHFKANFIQLESTKDVMDDTNFYEMYVSGVGCYLNGTSKATVAPVISDEVAKQSFFMEVKEILSNFENKVKSELRAFKDEISDNKNILSDLQMDLENLRDELQRL
ncbi:hypothetical protein ACFFRR_009000 [Megaselia abdita]